MKRVEVALFLLVAPLLIGLLEASAYATGLDKSDIFDKWTSLFQNASSNSNPITLMLDSKLELEETIATPDQSGDGYFYFSKDGKLIIETTNGTTAWRSNPDINETDVKIVILESGVTSIGTSAFNDCRNLETVDMSACTKLVSIGESAFYNCTNLKIDKLPSSISNIGDTAFSNCTNLKTMDMSICTKLVSIGKFAFNDCTNLEDLSLSACVRLDSIGSFAFDGCTNLKIDKLPASLTTIGNWAFHNCKSLSTLGLSACTKLTSIGVATFMDCTKLRIDELPSSIANIETFAFNGCTDLKLDKLPSNLTTIENWAFYECKSLSTLELSNCTKLYSIGDGAFDGCTNLKIDKLPSNLTTIGKWAFQHCISLETLDLSDCTKLDSIRNSTFCYCTNLKIDKLPSSLTTIENWAFYECKSLDTLDMSDCTKLDSIGTSAFCYCTNLTSLTLANSTGPKLGQSTFSRTPNLTIFVPYEATGYNAGYWAYYQNKIVYGAALSGLTISNETLAPTFFSGKMNYTISVPNRVEKATTFIPYKSTGYDSDYRAYYQNKIANSVVHSWLPTTNSGTLTPTFCPGKINYTVCVPNSVERVTVTPTAHDATTITVNNHVIPSGIASGAIDLKAGENTIISVTTKNSDEDSRTYTINIMRAVSNTVSVIGVPVHQTSDAVQLDT